MSCEASIRAQRPVLAIILAVGVLVAPLVAETQAVKAHRPDPGYPTAMGLQPGRRSRFSRAPGRSRGSRPPPRPRRRRTARARGRAPRRPGSLRRIGALAVKEEGAPPVHLAVEPPALGHHRHGRAPPDDGVVADRRPPGEGRPPDRAAGQRLRRRDASRLQERGGHVVVLDPGIAGGAGAQPRGVADQERDVVDLRVRGVAALADVPAALPERVAVVGGDDDQRVVEPPWVRSVSRRWPSHRSHIVTRPA